MGRVVSYCKCLYKIVPQGRREEGLGLGCRAGAAGFKQGFRAQGFRGLRSAAWCCWQGSVALDLGLF